MTTEISRKSLLSSLETVAPALAIHNLVPAMTHFWFTGQAVMAYNDQIAISVPCETDFQGAVPGNTLLSLLKATSRAKIELTGGDTELLVKAGPRSTFKLAMLRSDCFIFTMPEIKQKGITGASLKEVLVGVEGCLRSLGADTSIPEQLGVTLQPQDSTLLIYTTNNATISKAVVKLKSEPKFKKRVILPTAYCKQVISLLKKAEAGCLLITADHSMLTAGDVTVWSRLINCDQPYDFDKVIESHFPKGSDKNVVRLPKALANALARATVITDAKVDQARTKAKVTKGVLHLHSQSDRGEVKDKMKLDEGHPNVALAFEPKLLQVGLPDFEYILLTDRCIVMTNSANGLYLIAAVGA